MANEFDSLYEASQNPVLAQVAPQQVPQSNTSFNSTAGLQAIMAPAIIQQQEMAARNKAEAGVLRQTISDTAGVPDPVNAFAAALSQQITAVNQQAQDIQAATQRKYEINATVPKEFQALAGFFGYTNYDAAAQDVKIEQAVNAVKTGQMRLNVLASAADEVTKREQASTQALMTAQNILSAGNAEARNIENFQRTQALQQLESLSIQDRKKLLADPKAMESKFGKILGPGDVQDSITAFEGKQASLQNLRLAVENAKLTNDVNKLNVVNTYTQDYLSKLSIPELEKMATGQGDKVTLQLGNGMTTTVPRSSVANALESAKTGIMKREEERAAREASREASFIAYSGATNRTQALTTAMGTVDPSGKHIGGYMSVDPTDYAQVRAMHASATEAFQKGDMAKAKAVSEQLDKMVNGLVEKSVKDLPKEQQAATKELFQQGYIRNHQAASEAMQSMAFSATNPLPQDDMFYGAFEAVRQGAQQAQAESNQLLKSGLKTVGKQGAVGLDLERERAKKDEIFEQMLSKQGGAGVKAKAALMSNYDSLWASEALTSLAATGSQAFKGLYAGGNISPQYLQPGGQVNMDLVVRDLALKDFAAGVKPGQAGSNIDLLMRQLQDPTFQASVRQKDGLIHNTLAHQVMKTRLLNNNIALPVPYMVKNILNQALMVEQQAAATAAQNSAPSSFDAAFYGSNK